MIVTPAERIYLPDIEHAAILSLIRTPQPLDEINAEKPPPQLYPSPNLRPEAHSG